MASHLVTVKVGIVCRADQRMQLNSTTFPQNRLKCLNTESVQRRGTVQQYGMFFNDIFQNVPYIFLNTFYLFFRIFNIRSLAFFNKFLHNEGFEEFQGHFFR